MADSENVGRRVENEKDARMFAGSRIPARRGVDRCAVTGSKPKCCSDAEVTVGDFVGKAV